MNKKPLLFLLFVVAVIIVLTPTRVNSNINYPKAGNCGDPFTGNTCATGGCHAGPAQTPTASNFTLNIGTGTPSTPLNNSFTYTPGATYNIALLLNSSTGRYGFQIASLDASNAQAGNFAISNSNNTIIKTSVATGTRQYLGHLNANTNKNWAFKWTAPAAGTGAVTFYLAFNTANNTAQPGDGDIIYATTVTISEGATGIADADGIINDLQIYPNPLSDQMSLSFNLINAASVSAKLYSLNGKLTQQLINQKIEAGKYNSHFDVSTLPSGIYLLNLNIDGAEVTQKIVKQ